MRERDGAQDGAGPRDGAGEGALALAGAPSRVAAIRDTHPETLDEYAEAWHEAGRMMEHALWTRAAVAFAVRGQYGDKGIEEFAARVGRAPRTIWQLVQVFKAFPDENCGRSQNLSFHHHAAALKAKDPAKALASAEERGWSVREFRDHLQSAKKAKKAEPEIVAQAEAAQEEAPATPAESADFNAESEADLLTKPLRRAVQRWPENVSLKPLAERVRFVLKRIADKEPEA